MRLQFHCRVLYLVVSWVLAHRTSTSTFSPCGRIRTSTEGDTSQFVAVSSGSGQIGSRSGPAVTAESPSRSTRATTTRPQEASSDSFRKSRKGPRTSRVSSTDFCKHYWLACQQTRGSRCSKSSPPCKKQGKFRSRRSLSGRLQTMHQRLSGNSNVWERRSIPSRSEQQSYRRSLRSVRRNWQRPHIYWTKHRLSITSILGHLQKLFSLPSSKLISRTKTFQQRVVRKTSLETRRSWMRTVGRDRRYRGKPGTERHERHLALSSSSSSSKKIPCETLSESHRQILSGCRIRRQRSSRVSRICLQMIRESSWRGRCSWRYRRREGAG